MHPPPDEASFEAGKRAFLDMARMHTLQFVTRLEAPFEVTEQRRLKARADLMLDIAHDLNVFAREMKTDALAMEPTNKSGVPIAGHDPDRLPGDPKPTGQLGKVLAILDRTRGGQPGAGA